MRVGQDGAGWEVGHFVIAAGGYFLLFCAIFSRIVLSGRILATGDGFFHALPAFHTALRLWSPEIFSGYPVAADPQNMFWYPFSLLLPNGLRWFSLFVILGYTTAAFTQYVFVWLLTHSKRAAVVAGLVYGLSGFFAAHIGHVNLIQSAAWAPLFLAGIELVYQGTRTRGVALAAFGLAMCTLGGYPQVLVMTLMFGGLFASFRAVSIGTRWKAFLARCAAAVTLGLGMAGVLLVPLAELVHRSMRSAISYDFFVQGSFPPWQLVTLIFPTVAGGWHTPLNHVPYFGDWHISDVTGFVGLTALFLAIVALYRLRPRGLARFWAAVGGGSLILALGRSTPLAHVLYLTPVINKFRSPSRFLFGFTMAMPILAGLGLAALERLPADERSKTLQRALAAMAGILAVSVGIVYLTSGTFRAHAMHKLHAAAPAGIPWRAAAFFFPLLFFALSVLALWWWVRRSGSRFRSTVLIVAICLELLHFGWVYPREAFTTAAWFPQTKHRLAPVMDELERDASRYLPYDGKNQDRRDGVPNLPLVWRIPCASGCNPLILRRYATLLSMKHWGAVSPDVLKPSNRVLDLLAVRFVLMPPRRQTLIPKLVKQRSDSKTTGSPPLSASSRWTVWGKLGKTTVIENHNRLPRAWVVHRVLPLSDQEIVEAIATSRLPGGEAFDPAKMALISRGAVRHPLVPDAHASVELREIDSGDVSLHVVGDAPAFLVFSGVDYPGWQASVDGRGAAVVRTDALLRGVWIPAGSHDVRFDFRPVTFRIGLGLSAISCLLFFWLLWRGRRGAGTTSRV